MSIVDMLAGIHSVESTSVFKDLRGLSPEDAVYALITPIPAFQIAEAKKLDLLGRDAFVVKKPRAEFLFKALAARSYVNNGVFDKASITYDKASKAAMHINCAEAALICMHRSIQAQSTHIGSLPLDERAERIEELFGFTGGRIMGIIHRAYSPAYTERIPEITGSLSREEMDKILEEEATG